MAKKSAPTLFNPKPSRPTLPKKPSPATNTPSPGSSQSQPGSQSAPGTPKKPPATASTPASTTASPARAAPLRRAPPPKVDDDAPYRPPEGPCSEYKLMSSKLNGWKYDVMKFESRKRIEINDWAKPVKLNRKDLHRADPAAQSSQSAVSAMVGSDGKLVVGADGKVVMVDAQGRPIRHENGDAKDEKGKDKKKKPMKKTKQVFLVPDAIRQLRREEKYPWVIEDGTKTENWVAQMEEVAKSETHAMFMPAAGDVFKFVPAHRWYRFQKKQAHHIIKNLEEAESLMSKAQKRKDKTMWTLRQKTEAAAASGASLVYNVEQHSSRAFGGRKLRAVDTGHADLFGDDDDEEGVSRKRKIKREMGAEGTLDELDFEEGFADDEDRMEADDHEDDEAKELEERLKREYKTANKLREGYIDESEEEEDDETKLTGAGKNLQKALKKHENYDDSDDEKNPYASSEGEEEEEVPPPVPTGPAIIPPEPKPAARSATQTSSSAPPKPIVNGQGSVPVKTEPQSQSRATSPVPGHGGHSVVAKRATSPKVPKPKTGIPSRAGSPLASPTGVSPSASRATSPTVLPGQSGSGAPSNGTASPGSKPLKRKATEDAATTLPDGAPRPKKRKAPGELEDRMVIEWLRNTPNATTRECIQHFTRYLTDETKKAKFTALVKEVAQLSNNVLVLRPAYRASASSPKAG